MSQRCARQNALHGCYLFAVLLRSIIAEHRLMKGVRLVEDSVDADDVDEVNDEAIPESLHGGRTYEFLLRSEVDSVVVTAKLRPTIGQEDAPRQLVELGNQTVSRGAGASPTFSLRINATFEEYTIGSGNLSFVFRVDASTCPFQHPFFRVCRRSSHLGILQNERVKYIGCLREEGSGLAIDIFFGYRAPKMPY